MSHICQMTKFTLRGHSAFTVDVQDHRIAAGPGRGGRGGNGRGRGACACLRSRCIFHSGTNTHDPTWALTNPLDWTMQTIQTRVGSLAVPAAVGFSNSARNSNPVPGDRHGSKPVIYTILNGTLQSYLYDFKKGA